MWLREACDTPKVTRHTPGLRLPTSRIPPALGPFLASGFGTPDSGSPWAAADVSGSLEPYGHLRNSLDDPSPAGQVGVVTVSLCPHDLGIESHL